MPWRKRLLVLLAGATGLSLLAAGLALAAAGRPAAGGALAAATLGAAALALHALWPPFDLTGRSLRRGGRGSRAVALTFDDGPSGDTPAVLDALDRAGVQATFFVLGAAAERRPDLVREVARRGHAVALHGHTHVKLALAGPGTIARELDRCRDAIRAAGVEPAPWFRSPHGWKGPFLGGALRARGLTLVAWTRGVWDTERPGAAAIAARATERPRGGEILLLHDGCGTPGLDPRRDQTAEAIPEIVRRWREAGYAFVTLDAFSAGRGGVAAAGPDDAAPASLVARPAVRHGLRLAGLAAGVACAVVAFLRVDLREVGRSLSGAHPGWLAVGVGANLCSLAAHAARWRALLRTPEVRVRWRHTMAAVVAGFAAGIVLPARGGDLLRAHLLARRAGLPTSSVVVAAGLDYVVGALPLVVLLAGLVVSAPLPAWVTQTLWVTAAIAIAGGAAAWALSPRTRSVAGHGVAGLVGRMRAGLAAARAPRALAASLAWATVGWAAELGIALAALAALGLPATFTAAALAVVAATAAAAAGLSPGNAGSFELATAVALGAVGVPGGPALAFAVLFHLVHLVPVAVLGGAILLRSAVRPGAEPLPRQAPRAAPPGPLPASRGEARR